MAPLPFPAQHHSSQIKNAVIFTFVITFFLMGNASAFQVMPMESELEIPSAESPRALKFQIENTDGAPIEISLLVFRRTVDRREREVRRPTKDLRLSHTKLTLGPSEKKELEVSYVGAVPVGRENAYRLMIRQTSGSVRMTYVPSIYVRSGPAQANLIVRNAQLILSKGKVSFQIENSGNSHKGLAGIKLSFLRPDGQPVALDAVEIQKLEKEVILAGSSRRFSIPIARSEATLGPTGRSESLRAEVSF